jgi:hypothetical protein
MKAWPKTLLAAWCLGGFVRAADDATGDPPPTDASAAVAGPSGASPAAGSEQAAEAPGRLWPNSLPHVMDDVPGVERPRKPEVFLPGKSVGGLFPRPVGKGAAAGGESAPGDAAESGAASDSNPLSAPPEGMRSVLVPPPETTTPDRPGSKVGGRPSSVAADLVERILAPREPSRTRDARFEAALAAIGPTRPLPIVDALGRSGDRSRRQWVVGAYWKAAAAVMRLAWAAEAADHIDTIPPGADPLDRTALDVAAAASLAEVSSATAATIQSCQELADGALLTIGEPLPLPADRPLAVPYQTHFEAIFSQRLATGRIRAVDRMLPHLQSELESTGAGVLASMTALSVAEQAHARGDRTIEAVVHGIESLARERQRFLAALVQYNALIAEYVGAVADVGVDDARFAAMLIGTPLASSWNQFSAMGQEQPGAGMPNPLAGQPPAPPAFPGNAQVILP